MQTKLLDLTKWQAVRMEGIENVLSFDPLIQYLKERISRETTIKKHFFEFVLEKLQANPHLKEELTAAEMAQFKDELELVYCLVEPAFAEEEKTIWAISVPLDPLVICGTDAFYDMMQGNNDVRHRSVIQSAHEKSMVQKRMEFVYSVIFEKLYGQQIPIGGEVSYALSFVEKGLPRYFKINIDTRFIEVVAKGPLPPLNLIEWAKDVRGEDYDWSKGIKQLPLSLFKFRGLAIITVTDITQERAVENIKEIALSRHGFALKEDTQQVIHSLKVLMGSPETEFGLLPNLRVNDKLVFTLESGNNSILLQPNHCIDNGKSFQKLAEEYLNHPKPVLIDETAQGEDARQLLQFLNMAGIQAYALFPIFHSNEVAGVLEIYSYKKGVLNLQSLVKLKDALPVIAQLLKNSIDEFNNHLDNIVKDKFTALQPAVQWKFNEAAWNYLRENRLSTQKRPIEKIAFKSVFPLYGAIDIRNSTIERNKAMAADAAFQLELLITLLEQIRQQTGLVLVDDMIIKCTKWLSGIHNDIRDSEYGKLNEFLENKITPFLQDLNEKDRSLQPLIQPYLEETEASTGSMLKNIRVFDNALKTVNNTINGALEQFNNELQTFYPYYFEKFRTDGFEFDIYVGQDIAPQRPFSRYYLQNLRLRQLQVMAEIARETHALLPRLEIPLQTTQLIYIRSAPIDIVFRQDEHKFDVEGSYNIRYQVIKKRIDKVRILDTGERLTQPGKIALVYLNESEIREYRDYIAYLQDQQLLLDDLEVVELEELQGVTGLKALRVGVNVEKTGSLVQEGPADDSNSDQGSITFEN